MGLMLVEENLESLLPVSQLPRKETSMGALSWSQSCRHPYPGLQPPELWGVGAGGLWHRFDGILIVTAPADWDKGKSWKGSLRSALALGLEEQEPQCRGESSVVQPEPAAWNVVGGSIAIRRSWKEARGMEQRGLGGDVPCSAGKVGRRGLQNSVGPHWVIKNVRRAIRRHY